MEEELEKLRKHIEQFSKVVDFFASSVEPPLMYDSGIKHFGFRYGNPTVKHFCLLKAVRAVSGLNATICLAEKGFNQEVCVLIRTIIDCTAQIDFVLAGLEDGVLAPKQQKVVDAYFEDFHRNNPDDFKGSTIRQEDVHKEISRYLDDNGITGEKGNFLKASAKTLMSNVYRNFSNYMHARYPEVMDMFGGGSGSRRFHMEGMGNTPKDDESLAIISCFTDSVALVLASMIGHFDMTEEMKKIPELKNWFSD